nr:type IV toxin-antitoxin system AbiEi family antitoxin [Neorhizobium tomejilense]
MRQSIIAMKLLEASPTAVSADDLKEAGVSAETLRRMLAANVIERPAAGHYTIRGRTNIMDFDWVAFSLQVPTGVIGLLSAAVHHGMTQEMPPYLQAFAPRTRAGDFKLGGESGARVDLVTTRNKEALTIGIETVIKSGHPIKITSKERTLVDLFLFSPFCSRATDRSARIPEETFLDALSRCVEDEDFDFDTLHKKIAPRFGCADQISPFTKTSRFIAPRSPSM